jgi:hypothetical protein
MGNAYFDAHRDKLLAQADAMIAATPSLKKIAEQEERRCAKLVSDAQRKRP